MYIYRLARQLATLNWNVIDEEDAVRSAKTSMFRHTLH